MKQNLFLSKMQEQYRLDLDRAIELVSERDYGQALYCVLLVYSSATHVNPDVEAMKFAKALSSKLTRLVEMDFEEDARRKGLNITDENKTALLMEHSPHYVRFCSLLHDKQ